MTQLATSKSRTAARTEALVSYKGPQSNDAWEGLAVTIEGRNNGSVLGGSISQPATLYRTFQATSGGTTSITGSASQMTRFGILAGPALIGASLRVLRVINGALQDIRTATVTGANTDSWSRLGDEQPITSTSYQFRFDSFNRLSNTYRFGVARIGSDGRIGPVSTVDVTVAGPTYTTVAPTAPTTTGSNRAITGRDGALPAITGLVAVVRGGTTHNIDLSWNSAGTNEYVVFINWDGTADRLDSEATLTFASGPAILATDLLILKSLPFVAPTPNFFGNRTVGAGDILSFIPETIMRVNYTNEPGLPTWQYVAYGGAIPKPDITWPEYYLQLNGTASTAAQAERFFHAGTLQNFYPVLVPGRTYRFEFVACASSPINARFTVDPSSLVDQTVALTTTPQTYTFDFTVSSTLTSVDPHRWRFTAQTNNVSLRILSMRFWDTSIDYGLMPVPLPAGIDVRDHNLVKPPQIPSFDTMTSRPGFHSKSTWSLVSLLQNCREFGCNPHFQVEWLFEDQVYSDIITFLCAPASSGEPLALKREALGYGPVHLEFARWIWEDGNERWNPIMWAMFASATDSVTAQVYGQGEICAMFSAKRRAAMVANPYWPTSNPPVELSGGWIVGTSFSVTASDFPGADYSSVALYTAGWDVNNVLLADNARRWSEMLAIAQDTHTNWLTSLQAALGGTGRRLAVYEAGPGYQLSGLNGATVTPADEVAQEAMCKSIGGTTAVMSSVAIAATLGVGPYNFFTWGPGGYWSAAKRPSEGGSLYRVAGYLQRIHELLGACRIFSTSDFIARQRLLEIVNSGGTVIAERDIPRAQVYHFESITYPGRVGILYVNTDINYDAFGAGHPDYQAGNTGSALFRYHTGLPPSAVPFKVLRNEGNFRQHDAYQVGFRPQVVSNTYVGFEADPLCVDLTVTPEDFTVTDPTLRELTLLGGNCRLEIFTT